MAESDQKLLYDKIANNIQGNIVKINEILSSCKINSKFATNESQEKIAKFFEADTSSIIKNQSNDQYYDSENLAELFKLLDSGNTLSYGHKPLTIARSISLSSLGTTESDHQDNFTEVLKQFEELKEVLDSIVDCPIVMPDMNAISSQVTERKNEFIELVFTLQKLAKELRNISLTDDLRNKVDINSLPIDEDFINDLRKLRKNLENIQKLDANKNPMSVIQKKENTTINNPVISSICESIHNNRL